MSMALYSPEDVTIMLGGIYQIEGLLEGSFLSITKDEETYKTLVSTDGLVSRVFNASPTYTIKLTLMSVADDNSTLCMLMTVDTKTYSAPVPLFIKDGNGTSMFYSPSVWIEKAPEAIFGEGVEGREWVLRASTGTHVIGGNSGEGLLSSGIAQAGLFAAGALGII